jgi:uncharacterized membrane protein
MNLQRLARHLVTTRTAVRRAFPDHSLAAIEAAIKDSELAHVGEIRFVVEAALDLAPLWHGQTPRERAIEVFSQLRVWDTEYNNGVLIYLLLADRDVEIVADRGINARVAQSEWERVCHEMEAAFRLANYEAGVLGGIAAITAHLRKTFPAQDAGRNELADRPLLL